MFCKHPDTKTNLKALGYWRKTAEDTSDLPYPTEYVDDDFDPKIKQIVANYIKSCKAVNHWRGWSNCRICDAMLGSTCLSDGKYVFPEKFDHYITEHNVKPPREFLLHILAQVK